MGLHRKLGIGVVIVMLLVGSSGTPAAWAQSPEPTAERASTEQWVAAVFANIFYVPVKGLVICPLCAGAFVVIIVGTGGVRYNDAATVVHEGCGGKWIIKGEDIKFKRPGDYL